MEIKVGDVTAKWDDGDMRYGFEIPAVEFADNAGNAVLVPQHLVEAVARQL